MTAGRSSRQSLPQKLRGAEHLKRQVQALYGVLSTLYGSEELGVRADQLQAAALMRSRRLADRVLALQRLVKSDPVPGREAGPAAPITPREIPQVLEEVRERLADLIARKNVTDEVNRRVQERLEERQAAFMQELRLEVLREAGGVETPQSERRLAELERLEHVRVARPVLEQVRPRTLRQVVGQERAVRALVSKLAVPFPQHVILYGPPGVGKTTVARLALEHAKGLRFTPFGPDAPFVEVDGSALRWDARDATSPLLGSVHDPIYQGSRRDLAESGIPEPKLGLVTRAHGGVLFIDEIGELEPMLQAKLLKVLEDRRVHFESSYYDPSDPALPAYIRRLFEQGAPADFVLIGATTREPEEISPMIRSRCAERAGTEANFQLSVVRLPAEDDEVIEEQGARVFLEPEAALLLDDKILDASIEQDRVAFTIADQIEE